ncbi:hypothetical protein [Pleurocapsa sp. PCC 7319]|uniref:hypothetical protein n=1 Tax=Pleurocapsa sp. PCC 7319 TaxID=118161 RepID=UPI00034623CF|nr:hypothetical protein [Pleurocapsa sp. PCC 7319]
MIQLQLIFGLLGSIFTVLCFIPYIATTLQGKTKPNRATWWVWGINGSVLCLGNLAAGADYTMLPLICAVVAQLCIAILSIKHGEGGWNCFDRRCLIASGISFILWRILSYDIIAIILPLLIDILAALPTLKKSYFEPDSEDLLTYVLYTVGGLFTVLAVTNWSFEIAITPLYVLFINAMIVLLLTRHKTQFILSTYRKKI